MEVDLPFRILQYSILAWIWIVFIVVIYKWLKKK